MKKRNHSKKFKKKVVKEYQEGVSGTKLSRKYGIHKAQVYRWVKLWKELGDFPDNRGKHSTGRPPIKTIDTTNMSKDEYIAYLQMELDILKFLSSRKNRKQK